MATKKMYINGVEINAKLIPDLTALTAVEVTDTTKKSIPVADEDSPNDEAKRMLLSELSNLITDGAGVKVYEALLTQTGTDVPTATIGKNTIGTINLLYISDGTYNIQSTSGLFTVGKTFVYVGQSTDLNDLNFIQAVPQDEESIHLITKVLSTLARTNGILQNTPIKIVIYP
jgi:hypothetical protein